MIDQSLVEAIAAAVADKITSKGIIMPRLMDIEAAATYLGMTVDALRSKALMGKIPHVRLDRKWRFDRFEMDKWIEDHRQVA